MEKIFNLKVVCVPVENGYKCRMGNKIISETDYINNNCPYNCCDGLELERIIRDHILQAEKSSIIDTPLPERRTPKDYDELMRQIKQQKQSDLECSR